MSEDVAGGASGCKGLGLLTVVLYGGRERSEYRVFLAMGDEVQRVFGEVITIQPLDSGLSGGAKAGCYDVEFEMRREPAEVFPDGWIGPDREDVGGGGEGEMNRVPLVLRGGTAAGIATLPVVEGGDIIVRAGDGQLGRPRFDFANCIQRQE